MAATNTYVDGLRAGNDCALPKPGAQGSNGSLHTGQRHRGEHTMRRGHTVGKQHVLRQAQALAQQVRLDADVGDSDLHLTALVLHSDLPARGVLAARIDDAATRGHEVPATAPRPKPKASEPVELPPTHYLF